MEQNRLFAIDDLSKESDAEKKATLQQQIAQLEADIKSEGVKKAAAEKERDRLKEAKENSDKLAEIADQIANAKEETDSIIQDLQDGVDDL